MKIIIFCVSTVLCVVTSFAQVTNEGKPASWDQASSGVLKKSVSEIQMPAFNLEKIKTEDKINDTDRSKPYRFGHEFKVDIDVKKDGTLDVLSNGDHVYRVGISSKGAKTLNFVFDRYQIPTGATIYLYSDDKSDLLGAYTDTFNRPDKMLGTWMVTGEKVWIEYREPKASVGQGDLHLGGVVHGYRSVTDIAVQQKSLNDSGDCNRDVNCSIGSGFNRKKNRLKHSVALIIMQGYVCSGNLINNANNDGTPFFLTANHCDAGSESTWAFRFNWISPNPSCSTTVNSTDTSINQTTSGATRLATNSKSDVRLLRLDGGLGNDWDLVFAGWDRSGTTPKGYTVGIHHPAGDIMKICRANSSPEKMVLNFNGNSQTEMWRVNDWDLGVTEGGSSGSALFDRRGRIIGQLAGGYAACSGTSDNNREDWYGRFDISWNYGSTNSTRLSNWLDPENTGATTLNSISSKSLKTSENEVLGYEDESLDTIVSVTYSNPTNGILTITKEFEDRLTYRLFNIVGQEVGKGELVDQYTVLDMTSNVNGVYFMSIINKSNNQSITKKIMVSK